MPINPYEPPTGDDGPIPGRDNFSGVGQPGFFGKTNSRATTWSLLAWSVAGAIPPPLFIWFGLPATELDWSTKIAILPFASLFGAAIAFLCEWQLDD